jgi:hypothetical protein
LQELFISNSPGLERVDFPELLRLRGPFRYQAPQLGSALVALSAPKLAEIGDAPFAIENSLITSLDEIGAADWKVQASMLQLTNNSALSQCLVDAFIERCKAGGFSGFVSTYGNAACP